MKPPKAIHDLFLFKDDLFRNKAEIFRNEWYTGVGQNRTLGQLPRKRDCSKRKRASFENLMAIVLYLLICQLQPFILYYAKRLGDFWLVGNLF